MITLKSTVRDLISGMGKLVDGRWYHFSGNIQKRPDGTGEEEIIIGDLKVIPASLMVRTREQIADIFVHLPIQSWMKDVITAGIIRLLRSKSLSVDDGDQG